MNPTFSTIVEGKAIIVTLKMAGKSQDIVVSVWTQYGPLFGNKPEHMAAAKAIVDEKIASLSPIDFGKWLKDSGMKVKITV